MATRNQIIHVLTEAVVHPYKCITWLKLQYLEIRMHISKNSIFKYDYDLPMASLLPKTMIDKMIDVFRPRSILDIGCGTGRALDYFVERGIFDVVGIEGSVFAIQNANHPELIINHNLNREINLNRKFDLIYSFEFVEHIHSFFLDNLLRTFSYHADTVIITAAQPGQSGRGHLNVQCLEYWIKQFGRYNYVYDNEDTHLLKLVDDIFSENILVFKR